MENIARYVLSVLYERAVFKTKLYRIANFIAGTVAPQARSTQRMRGGA
ncbi:hypothetical protein [Streptomyces sp. NPDC007172]